MPAIDIVGARLMKTASIILSAALLLGSCAPAPTSSGSANIGNAGAGTTPPPSAASQAPQLIGMSESRLRRCAGEPSSTTVSVLEGPTRFLFYRTGQGESFCKATFTVRSGRVEET